MSRACLAHHASLFFRHFPSCERFEFAAPGLSTARAKCCIFPLATPSGVGGACRCRCPPPSCFSVCVSLPYFRFLTCGACLVALSFRFFAAACDVTHARTHARLAPRHVTVCIFSVPPPPRLALRRTRLGMINNAIILWDATAWLTNHRQRTSRPSWTWRTRTTRQRKETPAKGEAER